MLVLKMLKVFDFLISISKVFHITAKELLIDWKDILLNLDSQNMFKFVECLVLYLCVFAESFILLDL